MVKQCPLPRFPLKCSKPMWSLFLSQVENPPLPQILGPFPYSTQTSNCMPKYYPIDSSLSFPLSLNLIKWVSHQVDKHLTLRGELPISYSMLRHVGCLLCSFFWMWRRHLTGFIWVTWNTRYKNSASQYFSAIQPPLHRSLHQICSQHLCHI